MLAENPTPVKRASGNITRAAAATRRWHERHNVAVSAGALRRIDRENMPRGERRARLPALAYREARHARRRERGPGRSVSDRVTETVLDPISPRGDRAARRTWLLAGALLVWAASVAAALWAQYQIAPLGHLEQAVWLYALAAVLGSGAIWIIDREVPLPEPAAAPLAYAPNRWRRAAGVVLLAAGIGAVGYAVHILDTAAAYAPAFDYWCAGLLLTALALWIGGRGALLPAWRRPSRAQLLEIGLVLAILAVAVALRLPDLVQIPPEVHGDEAACGLEARRILHGEVPNLFGVGWYQIPNISFAISAAVMWLFGEDLWGFRIASVIQGTLAVLLLYLLAKRLFSRRIAAVAAFLLAVSHWHIHFSRSGINYVQAQVATLLVLYFLVRAMQNRRVLNWLLAGFSMGLCVNVYYAARLAPVLGAAFVGYALISERGFLRRQAPGIAALGLGVALFLAPMTIVFSQDPQAFTSRTEGVFILSKNSLNHAFYTYQVKTIPEVLRIQVERTLTAFNWRGETSLQHNHRGPLIDFWASALFVVGVAAVTVHAWRRSYFLVAVWFWLTLVLGAIFTIDAMFSPRVIAAVPVLFLFPALVVDAGWRASGRLLGRWGTWIFAVPALAFLALSAQQNYQDYFVLHIGQMQTAGGNTILSHYAAAMNDRYQVYLLGRTSLLYDTERFLIPDVDGVDVREDPLPLPLRRIPQSKGIVFIVDYFWPEGAERLRAIQQAYPNGKTDILKTTAGIAVYHVHVVEPQDLIAAAPDAVREPRPLPAVRVAQAQAARGAWVPPPRPAPVRAQPARPRVWLTLADLPEAREVAVANGGVLFVVDPSTKQVRRYSAEGVPLGAVAGIDKNAFEDPRAVAAGPDGNAYVLDAKRDLVAVLGPDGALLRTIVLPGAYFPNHIAIDADGSVVVADTGQSRVMRVAPDGQVTTTVGPRGSAPLDQPTTVALGPDGEIFVVDGVNPRLVVLGPDLGFQREWPVPPSPILPGAHALIADGHVLLSQPNGGAILRYDLQGQTRGQVGAGALQQPVGLTRAPDGALLVVDPGAGGIVRLNLPGQPAAAATATQRSAPPP